MISEKMFVDACRERGAKQVSTAAREAFNGYMKELMHHAARHAVASMKRDRRVRIEPVDIPRREIE